MKTLYKIGYKIDDDPSKWNSDINNIIMNKYVPKKIVSKYTNKEKNWKETYKNICINTKTCTYKMFDHFMKRELIIEKVFVNFNRYQERVYLSIIFDGDIRKEEAFKEYRNYLFEELNGFADKYMIPFKEVDLYATYDTGNKYKEEIVLENPVLITMDKVGDDFKLNNENSSKNIDIYYKYDFVSEETERYLRSLEHIYKVDSYDSIGICAKHFDSVFILFHRSYEFFQELHKIDESAQIFAAITNKMNEVWSKERVKLLVLNRFLHAGLYNKTFFGVLELNAQMDSIYNQMRREKQILQDKYDKQYERVFYNFDEERTNSIYFKELLKYLYSHSEHRERLLIRLKESFEPTDAQIERLRNDNDSKANFALQWIMSILSVVIFLYGSLTLWYGSTIIPNQMIAEVFLDNSGMMPRTLLVIVGLTITLIFVLVMHFMRHNSAIVNRNLKEVIRTKELYNPIIKKYELKIRKNRKRHKLLLITEFFQMITTYMILREKTDEEKTKTIIKAINEIE